MFIIPFGCFAFQTSRVFLALVEEMHAAQSDLASASGLDSSRPRQPAAPPATSAALMHALLHRLDVQAAHIANAISREELPVFLLALRVDPTFVRPYLIPLVLASTSLTVCLSASTSRQEAGRFDDRGDNALHFAVRQLAAPAVAQRLLLRFGSLARQVLSTCSWSY